MKLFAKKSLGQHFLNSTHVLEQIISAAYIQKGEKVLEIGPGTGVLTRALLGTGAQVVAIEKDQRAVGMLEQDFFNEVKNGALKIISGDVLDESLLLVIPAKATREQSERSGPHRRAGIQNEERKSNILQNNSYALVANIPYYITGAILEKFLEHEPRPNRMILLVQKEVAERIVARDGKESILSVSVKAFGTPKIIAKVSPGAFTPPPTVDSAILAIENISANLFVPTTACEASSNTIAPPETPKNVDIARFFRIVKAGFAHKRKYVVRNLEAVLSSEEIADTWKRLGLDLKVRAEDLKVGDWVRIATEK